MLIILAGITLNAVIGEGGIIFQARDTRNKISNETTYDNAQLAQLQNELKDNGLYSGIGIIPGTDNGGGSEGGENGTITNSGGGTNTGINQGGIGTNTSGNAMVRPSQNQEPGGGTIIDGKTNEDPKIYVVSGEEIAASFYQSDVTIQIFTNDRSKKIKYILSTTVDTITNELYPSGLVRELDIENGGTLTFTKDGEYTITAYAYDLVGNKSNPTVMWLKRQVGGSTTGGITVSVASGNEGANKWYTSNVTLRVLGTDTGSKEVRYRVQGTATGTGVVGNLEVIGPGTVDTKEVPITNGTTFRIVADGEYTITAYSYDAGGIRLTQSEVINLKKDATRPQVNSFTGEQIPGTGFKVTIDAVDVGAGLTTTPYNYRYRLAESNGEYTGEVSSDTAKTYTGLDQEKTYDMYVVITDEAGNKAITDTISRPSLWISNDILVGETVSNGVEGARKYSRSETIQLKFRGQDSNNVDISKTAYQVIGTVIKEGMIADKTVAVGEELKDEYQLSDKETKTIQLRADGNWTVKVKNYNKEGKIVSTNVMEITRDITEPSIISFKGTIVYGTTGGGTMTVVGHDDTSGVGTTDTTYTFYLGNEIESTQKDNSYNYSEVGENFTGKVSVRDKAGNLSDICDWTGGTAFEYSFVGAKKNLTLAPGKYRLEVWGAQGGRKGGVGGYSVGDLSIIERLNLFVYIGGQGGSGTGGFNGGGSSAHPSGGGGGGGTDVRLISDTLWHRVIVAGGGGGGGTYYHNQYLPGVGGGKEGGIRYRYR